VAAELRAAAARATDGVQLVNEDDRRRRLPRLLEQVPYAGGANAHDHLDELGRTEAEEGDPRLSSNRAGQERLAGSWRTDEQHALRHGASEPLVLGRVFQEVDDLDQLVLGLVDPRNVVESDRWLLLTVALSAAAPQAEQSATCRCGRAATDPDKGADQQQGGAKADEQLDERGRSAFVDGLDDHTFLFEPPLKILVGEVRPLRLELHRGACLGPVGRRRCRCVGRRRW
jgi:hypothetical protein